MSLPWPCFAERNAQHCTQPCSLRSLEAARYSRAAPVSFTLTPENMNSSFQHSGVLIRPITSEDKPSLFAAVRESIDTVGRWMSWCHPDYSTNDTDQWISLCQRNWQSGIDREFGIFDAVSGKVLGCVGLNQINRINNFGNLGYWVRTSRTGKGVASTAATMAARFAFDELKLSRVEIIACLDNVASRRVAEKIGGHFEGVARNRLQLKGVPCDAAVYSLLPNDITG